MFAAPILRDSLADMGSIVDGGVAVAPKRLLLVDDDENMLRTLRFYFERRGFHVIGASTVAEAQTAFGRCGGWALVIADYHLPDGNGWQLCCWLRTQPREAPPFLLISGAEAARVLASTVPFLAKPFSIGQLATRVDLILQEHRT